MTDRSRPTWPRGDWPQTDRPPADARVARPVDRPAYDVRRLMQGGTQAHLVLDGIAYTLRITRSGKLILTK